MRDLSGGRPKGRLDGLGEEPLPTPFAVSGWALSPGTTVSAVELFVDGRCLGRARLGLSRPDVARRSRHVDASVSGFERIVLPADVPARTNEVTVSVVGRDLTGRTFPIGERTVQLSTATSVEHDDQGAAQPRERMRLPRGPSAAARRGDPAVLVFTHSLRPGGAELWLSEVLERFAMTRTALAVVSPSDGPLRVRLEALGIPVRVAGDHPLDSVDGYEGRLAELAAWAAPKAFDVALVNTIVAFPGVDLAALLGIPSIFAVHESIDLEAYWLSSFVPGPSHPHVRERARRALGTATAVVFEADATRRVHLRHGDPARFLTLPYGIDLGRIDRFRRSFDAAAARRRLGLSADATVVLSLGKVQPRKGQAGLVQAFGALASDYPEAMLALVGVSASSRHLRYAEAVRERVRHAGQGPRVLILPLVDEPYPWLGVADVLVCASDLESLPRAVLEAMAFEVPVLATEVFGLPELIEDGRSGWLCEPNDVGALAGALERVLTIAPGQRRAIGREGGRTVRERHAADAYARRLSRLVCGLAADPRASPAALVS
jgi:D-inositol-3-phosphate glycosyltransferase